MEKELPPSSLDQIDQKIKEILKVPSSNTNKAINNSSTIEESIMEKIKK